VTAIFTGDSEGDPNKKILAKLTTRDILRNRYAKFYKIRTEEIDASFGYFFYNIYQTVYPAQIFLRNPENTGHLKQINAEAFMDKATVAAERRLNSGFIEERIKQDDPVKVIRQLKADMSSLSAAFDAGRKMAADQCYDLLMTFAGLVNFNYLALLQKFDSRLEENIFNYAPKFETIRAEYIVEDMTAFLAVSNAVRIGSDWGTVLRVLKTANRGTDVIFPEQWNKLLIKLQDLRQSNIIPLMIQYTLKNPVWQLKEKKPGAVTESWIDIKKTETQELVDKMTGALRHAQSTALAKKIFGAADITRLRYYNHEKDKLYRRKNLISLTYASGLNYLAAFIEEYLDKEIRELCDILLIRGHWASNAASMEMSEHFHELSDMSKPIADFDEALSEEGKLGSRLKTAMLRVDRNSYQMTYINSILTGVNAQALEMLNAAVESLLIIGRYLKNLREDHKKIHHDMIINWKELDMVSQDPLAQRIAGSCDKTDLFTQLMTLYTNPPEY
jgi:hypothetical protein